MLRQATEAGDEYDDKSLHNDTTQAEKAPHDTAHVRTTPTSTGTSRKRQADEVKGPPEVLLEMLSRAEKICLIPTTLPQ